MLLAGLALKFLLSGSQIKTLLASLESQLGAPVSAAGGDFDLAGWFLFQPAVTIHKLSIGNPQGFSRAPLLEADEVAAQVGLLALLQDRIHIRSFTLRRPQLTVEQDSSGRSNLQALVGGMGKTGGRSAPTSGSSGQAQAPGMAIDQFSIRSGTIRFSDKGKKETFFTIRHLDLALEDFAIDKAGRMSLAARLFGGEDSRVDFKGRAGPFGATTAPAQGDLSVILAPREIPADVRAEYFGDLLREPGDQGRATLRATLRGDLMGTVEGSGKLTVQDMRLGIDREHRIPLHGEIPLQVTVRNLLANPSFELQTRDAALQLGRGRWKGQAEAHLSGSTVRGASSGSITGAQIGELLDAFTTARGKASGIAAVPEYRIRFAGKNAAEIRNSLNGQGVLTLEKGRFAVFDLLESIQSYAKKMRTGETPAPGETAFLRFRSNFQIADGQMRLADLVLENPSAQITGKGHITFAQELSFDLATDAGGTLAQVLGGKPDSEGRIRVRVPVKIGGTVTSPKVYPDVGRLVTEKATEKAAGFLERLLKKKQEPK